MTHPTRHVLPGNPVKQPAHRFKTCAKCKENKPPEGGIEMGPERWYCGACWTLRATRSPKGAAK
jgi:hypothetical protein